MAISNALRTGRISPGAVMTWAKENDPSLRTITRFRSSEVPALKEVLHSLDESADYPHLIAYFRDEQTAAECIPEIADALTENDTVSKLWLSGGSLDARSARAVAALLRKNTSLEVLRLVGMTVGRDSVSAIARALAHNTTLKSLCFERCDIGGDDGVKSVAKALGKNNTLAELFLTRCGVGLDGARAVASALRYRNHAVGMLGLDAPSNARVWRVIQRAYEYADVNREHGPSVGGEMRKTGRVPRACLQGSVPRTVLPTALERVVRTRSLSVAYDLVRRKYGEVLSTEREDGGRRAPADVALGLLPLAAKTGSTSWSTSWSTSMSTSSLTKKPSRRHLFFRSLSMPVFRRRSQSPGEDDRSKEPSVTESKRPRSLGSFVITPGGDTPLCYQCDFDRGLLIMDQ